MRIALCNELLKGSWSDVVAAAAELGYEGLEVAPYTLAEDARRLTQADRLRIREEAESHGLRICGLHWLLVSPPGLHLAHPDERVRRRTVEYMGELARLCSDLGGEVMVLGSPKQRSTVPGQSREEAWRLLGESLKAAARAAEEHGVVIALEPLARHLTDVVNTAREAVRMVEEVGSPALRVNLDVYSMSDEGRPYAEIIEEVGPLLAHFHANDTNGLGPGMGEADYGEILAALRRVGYAGWLSVEVLAPVDKPLEVARASIEYLRQLLAANVLSL
jgi:sugar phosphate isomerase/epimerase